MLSEIKKLNQWIFNKEIIKFLPIDLRNVNWAIVNKYSAYPNLMELAAKWNIQADYELAEELKPLKILVDRLQPVHRHQKTILYRGVFPDTMKEEWNIFDVPIASIRKMKPGETMEMTLDFPVSFTDTPNIARRFGNVLIRYDATPHIGEYLRFTDELQVAMFQFLTGSARIDEREDNVLLSQREYVSLPSAPITFQVEIVRNTPGSFDHW
ncbi:sulfurtransferase TusA family protein [Salmonella enterica subsp. enterica serovar Anatum]